MSASSRSAEQVGPLVVEFSGRESVPLSALNHLLFCPRRCALIHVEGIFSENRYTLEGRFGHERADSPGLEVRAGTRVARALPLFSERLALSGKADIVEFHEEADGQERPCPVDYKRGVREKWDNDDVQLCAQALCLEEMLSVHVPEGAIYHMTSRRRRPVVFDAPLRSTTLRAIEQLHALIASQTLPPPVRHRRCEKCSLKPTCLPELADHRTDVVLAAQRLFLVDEG